MLSLMLENGAVSKFHPAQFLAFQITEVREEHQANADSPMLVTELGMVTEVRAEQPYNALLPMLVTELGMVIEVREEQL